MELKPTRDGYGLGLVDAGKKDAKVVVLCADLSESTRSHWFKKEFPARFVQIGVSEQSMAAIASGLALAGKVPFISSYAGFSPGRNWEQIRTTITLNDANVKVAGAHAGVSVGPDGATHQMTEDLALMRTLPNMVVLAPCDMQETKKATVAVAGVYGPHYLRFGREKSPVFTTPATPFKIGRAEIFRFGRDVTIVACGILVHEALKAAEELRKKGIEAEVIDSHTIKPLDAKTILASIAKTGCVVTVEEHQVDGGLGAAVAEALGAARPVPLERIGVQNRYGESGEPIMLLEAFGLTSPYIAMAARRATARKAGKKVSEVPDYMAAAERRAVELKKQVISEALSRAPREWGGKKGNIKDLIKKSK
ncbi:transketolase family protein [Patescibacteria group bacterium]|nr:MAG: transketolase family protein [Patescibacteria group bacterium]